MLIGFNQNGNVGQESRLACSTFTDNYDYRRTRKNLTHSVCEAERGNPVQFPFWGQ
jgi:hypothetical protein